MQLGAPGPLGHRADWTAHSEGAPRCSGGESGLALLTDKGSGSGKTLFERRVSSAEAWSRAFDKGSISPESNDWCNRLPSAEITHLTFEVCRPTDQYDVQALTFHV